MFALAPIAWLVGVKPIWVQLTVGLCTLLLASKASLRFPAVARALAVYSAIYACSIVLNLTRMPMSRALGSLANLSIWVCGLGVVLFVVNARQRRDVVFVARALVALTCMSGVVAISGLAFLVQGRLDYALVSPAISLWPSALIGQSEIVRDGLTLTVVRPDMTSLGPLPRSGGFFEYPNALALATLSSLPFIFSKVVLPSTVLRAGAVALAGASLLLSGSRTTVVGLVLAALLTLLVWDFFRARGRSTAGLITLMALLLVFGATVLNAERIYTAAQEYRPGSTRVSVLIQIAEAFAESPSKLLGIGHKPRTDLAEHPIGSHSTLFGSLLKTGLVGFSAMAAVWLTVLWACVRLLAQGARGRLTPEVRLICIAALAGMAWQLVEDLDAPSLAAMAYFFVLGNLTRPELLYGRPSADTSPITTAEFVPSEAQR